MEKWKNIPNSRYRISSLGQIRNSETGRVLKQQTNKRGYAVIRLKDNDKKKISFCVHKLVAKAFVPNPNGYLEINHLDGDKLNNYSTNLQWCTRGQNIQHAWDNGLRHFTENARKAVLQNIKKAQTPEVLAKKRYPRSRKTLCVETGQVFKSMKAAADYIGAYEQNIQECCASGGRRTSHGYHWEYVKEKEAK